MSPLSMLVMGIIIVYWVSAAIWVAASIPLFFGWAYKLIWRNRGIKANFNLRKPLIIWCASYLIAGLAMGLAFKLATPAMSWWGIGYFIVFWPIWQTQDLTGIYVPIPNWMFSF